MVTLPFPLEIQQPYYQPHLTDTVRQGALCRAGQAGCPGTLLPFSRFKKQPPAFDYTNGLFSFVLFSAPLRYHCVDQRSGNAAETGRSGTNYGPGLQQAVLRPLPQSIFLLRLPSLKGEPG